jgi:DnaJ-class molecular chaperone
VTFSEQGDQGPNKLPGMPYNVFLKYTPSHRLGDIVFIASQKPHARFERSSNDLVYKAKISLVEALTGTVLDVETLDGRILKIPINDTIGPDYVKRVPGEGMPLSNNPSQRGDLLIKFSTAYPGPLTEQQKALLKKTLS